MHILEHFSLSCGLKTGKAFIQEDFFPVPFSDFICINNDHSIPSFCYSHWTDVFDILKPYLNKSNIKVLQIGSQKDQLLPHCEDFRHIQNRHQASYIINRSKLFVGSDIFYSNIASHFNTPGVILFGPIPPSCIKPFWNRDNFNILCANKTFSYASSEPSSTIDEIKPEIVANSILEKLKIPFSSDQNTEFIGDLYSTKIFEIIPNFSPDPNFLKDSYITMRCDYVDSLDHIIPWAQNRKMNLITDKKIDLRLLSHLKKSIKVVHYEVSNDTSKDIVEQNILYFKSVKQLGINISLFRKEEDNINNLRLNYFDWNLELLSQHKPPKEIMDNNNLLFYSGKLVFSNGKKYPSLDHAINNLDCDSTLNKVLNTDLFWSESDHYRIISKNS